MKYHSLTFVLLSIATSAERAAEIEGDLIEQAHIYGAWWMRRQALLVAVSLFGRAISTNPISISLLCLPVFAAIFLSVMLSEWLFLGPIGSYLLQPLAIPEVVAKLAVLSLAVFPAAYLIGVVLVRLAPSLGPKVAVVAALVFSIFVMLMQLRFSAPSMLAVSLLKVCIAIGLVAIPILWGSVSTHRRASRRRA